MRNLKLYVLLRFSISKKSDLRTTWFYFKQQKYDHSFSGFLILAL